jgi:PP-loop superfamily ATP-utilizing enzyme
VELKDKTMDSIQDMAKKYDLKDELITVNLVPKFLLNTKPKCSICFSQVLEMTHDTKNKLPIP